MNLSRGADDIAERTRGVDKRHILGRSGWFGLLPVDAAKRVRKGYATFHTYRKELPCETGGGHQAHQQGRVKKGKSHNFTLGDTVVAGQYTNCTRNRCDAS